MWPKFDYECYRHENNSIYVFSVELKSWKYSFQLYSYEICKYS